MRGTLILMPLLAGALLLGACGGEDSTPPQETQMTTDEPTAEDTPTADQDQAGFTNPVWPHNFPDPQILAREDGGYMAIATNGNGQNVQRLDSQDMVTWEQGADVLPSLPQWSYPGKVWAPEIIRWTDGTYRLYYTTRSPDPEVQCISVASSAALEGPYEDVSAEPMICETEEGGSIDQSPFIASDGSAWLYWKNDGNAIGVDTWIRVQQLTDDGLGVTGEITDLLQQDLPWEEELVEGPVVVEIDGLFHMFYSGNGYWSSNYAVGHATAPSPTGPFTKSGDPVLVANDVASGPGHNHLIEVEGQWWTVYHAWEPGFEGMDAIGRQMWLSTVEFDGENVTVQPPMIDNPLRPGR